MLKYSTLLVVLLAIAGCTKSHSEDSVSEASILELEQSRFNAMAEGNIELLDQIISDDLYYIHSNGNVDTKESFIGAIKDGTQSYDEIEINEAKTRIYGDAAIINGICTYHRRNPDGTPNNLQLKYTNVYAKIDNDWKMVSWQSFRMGL